MTRLSRTCRICWRFVEYGAELEPGSQKQLEWIVCDHCREREARKRVEVTALEALWQVRACEAPDCSATFEPAQSRQRFCSDRCRKRAYARAKAQRV